MHAGRREPGLQSCQARRLVVAGMWLTGNVADGLDVGCHWMGECNACGGVLTPIIKRIKMHCLLMEGCTYGCTGPQVAVSWLPDGS